MFFWKSIKFIFSSTSRDHTMRAFIGIFSVLVTMTVIAIVNVPQSTVGLHLEEGLTIRILIPYQEQALEYGILTFIAFAIVVSLYVAETISAVRNGEFTLTFESQDSLSTRTFIGAMIPVAVWILVANGTDSANAQRMLIAFVLLFYVLTVVLILGAIVLLVVVQYAPRMYVNALVWTIGAVAGTLFLDYFALLCGVSVEGPLFIMMVLLVIRYVWVFLADNTSLLDKYKLESE